MATKKSNAEKLAKLQEKIDNGGELTENQQAQFDDLTEKEARREELQTSHDNGDELSEEELEELLDLGGEVTEEEEEKTEAAAPKTSNPKPRDRKTRKPEKGAMEPTHRANTQDSDRVPEDRASRDKVYTAESRDRWPTTTPAEVLAEQRSINEANKK
jgi:hypothetical protein